MLSAAEEGLGSVGPHTSEGQSKVVRASSPETMQRAGPSLTQAGNAPSSQLHPLVWHLGDPGNAKSKCGRSILAGKKKRKKRSYNKLIQENHILCSPKTKLMK